MAQNEWGTGRTDWNQTTVWSQTHLSQSPTNSLSKNIWMFLSPCVLGCFTELPWQSWLILGIRKNLPVSKTVLKFKWIHIRCLQQYMAHSQHSLNARYFCYWYAHLHGYETSVNVQVETGFWSWVEVWQYSWQSMWRHGLMKERKTMETGPWGPVTQRLLPWEDYTSHLQPLTSWSPPNPF